MKKALIAMSGGVDSSVAAYLTLQKGFSCLGATMLLHSETTGKCSAPDAATDAENVARRLGMDFHVLDFTHRFRTQVMDHFVHAYENGLTPNPCIQCNRYLKFSSLLDAAQSLGCHYVVTGHYARIEWSDERNRWLLKKAKNEPKDQSYVLYFLTQEQLAHTRFPLGEFESKDQIRAIAEEYGFVTAKKLQKRN